MSHQYIDQRWYDELCQIKPVNNASSILQSTVSAAAESAFLRSGTVPSFLYNSSRYDEKLLAQKADSLQSLRQRIEGVEPDDAIKHAYVDKIDELLTTNDLIYAALTRDWGKFRDANQTLWGPYEAELQAGAGWMLGQFVRDNLADNPDSRFDALLQHFAKWDTCPEGWGSRLPDNDTFLRIKNRAQEQPILHDQKMPRTIPLSEVVIAATRVLARYAPSYRVSYTDNPVVHFKVSHSRGLLMICGPQDAQIHNSRYRGLVLGHEIGVHILRRHNGGQGKLGLFVSGGAGSNSVEEGLGVVMEQLQWSNVGGAFTARRFGTLLSRYHAVGMVRDGYTFHEVYEFYKMLYTWFHHSKSEERAHHYAWRMVVSVYRGTPADTSGTVFMRPSVYLKQTLAVWQALAENSELLNISTSGKFNILSKNQTDLAKQTLIN